MSEAFLFLFTLANWINYLQEILDSRKKLVPLAKGVIQRVSKT